MLKKYLKKEKTSLWSSLRKNKSQPLSLHVPHYQLDLLFKFSSLLAKVSGKIQENAFLIRVRLANQEVGPVSKLNWHLRSVLLAYVQQMDVYWDIPLSHVNSS